MSLSPSYRRLALLGLLALLGACSAPPRPNILFIVIDTLRFDRVGAYGAHADLTPFLNSYAERSNVFWRAYAQSSWTSPAVASMLTSRYQSQHGIVAFNSVLADSEYTLAEALKDHGYATGGFSANILIHSGVGYGQGFDNYQILWGPQGKESAAKVDREALAWLDSLKKPGQSAPPVFLYLQYMEPHEPLKPPAAILEQLLVRRAQPPAVRRAATALLAKPRPLARIDGAKLPAIEDLYDAEVRSIDAALQSFLSRLRQRGFLDNAIVVIVADHGEEFYEHGRIGHGRTLYNEVIHIPLMIHLPAQTGRADIHDIVSQVDLAPTLLDLAGIPRPPSFEGRSLRGIIRGSTSGWYVHSIWDRLTRRQPGGSAYSELLDKARDRNGRGKPHVRAIIEGARKLILGIDGDVEGYDLQKDPSETKPRGLSPEIGRRLESDIQRIVTRLKRDRAPKATMEMDEQTKERLRVLGYSP